MKSDNRANSTRFPEYEARQIRDREGRPAYGSATKLLFEFDNAFDVPCILNFKDGYLDGSAAIQTPTGWSESWVMGRFVSGKSICALAAPPSDFERRERALDHIRRSFATETFIDSDGFDPRITFASSDPHSEFLPSYDETSIHQELVPHDLKRLLKGKKKKGD